MRSLMLAAVAACLPGPLKRPWLRVVSGARIGRGARIGFGTVIWARGITIGEHAVIGSFCRIKAHDFRIDSHASIGDRVRLTTHTCHLHSRAIISPGVTVTGDAHDPRSELRMGMHSWVLPECHVNTTRAVRLGRNVGVGGGTYIFTHGFWLSKLEGYPVAFGDVEMGDDVWIPWGCFVLPGVRIGSGVVMGARSLVNKDVPDGALIGGIPARVIRERSNRDVTPEEKLAMLAEVTEDFARYHGLPFQRDDKGGTIDLTVGGDLIVRIHRDADPVAGAMASSALNILTCAPGEGSEPRAPWWCAADSRSSSWDTLPAGARRWLDHARLIGLRFYPVDELAQYPGVR